MHTMTGGEASDNHAAQCDRWAQEGLAASKASHWKWTPNPYEKGTEAYAEWREGYQQGALAQRLTDNEWTLRMHQRTERLRDAHADLAEKQRLWDHYGSVERAIRASAPAEEPADSLVVASPRTGSDHYRYKVIHGPRDAAFAWCSQVFATDSCTPMYEHMLWKLWGVDEQPGGTVSLWLSKSDYAGD